MENHDTQAVLTGDIVASQKLSEAGLCRARAVLADAAAEIALWADDLLPRPLEVSRGDAWQLLLSEPSYALRAALWIRSALIADCGVDTRIAVGIAEAGPLAASLAFSGGPAFVSSGQMLDEMGRERLVVVLPVGAELAPWVGLAARLCDTLIVSWTQRQAELVHAVLHPQSPTQSAIAASLSPPVSKQAVGKGLRAAHWDALSLALETFESTEWPQRLAVPVDTRIKL